MPEFDTYVDVDVEKFLSACSRREKDELIDILEEDGWVKRIAQRGTKSEDQPLSILEIEWQEMCNKLSDIRLRISIDDEEIIKEVLMKY